MINILFFLISKVMDLVVEMPFVKKKLYGKNVEKIINFYSKGKYTKSFAKFRFWYGPLHELNRIVPKNERILDIGSGEGILSNFLAISSSKRRIISIEINRHRIKEADKGIENVTFKYADALKIKFPTVDTIVISHVLHHLGSKTAQVEILKKCYTSLKNGGSLIIAEEDKEFTLACLFGWLADVFLIPIFFEKKFIDLNIYYRSRREWVALLKDIGFKIKSQKVTKDRIYPEVIILAKKQC